MDVGPLNTALAGTFDGSVGLEYQRIEPTEVIATLVVSEQLLGPRGCLHGGVLATGAEATASTGTALAVANEGMVAFGMNLSSRSIREVPGGDTVKFVARRVGVAPDAWTWVVDTVTAAGDLCATATVSIAVRPGP